MADASSTAVTVINTAMVVGGSINGTLAVGQTVVGAGVPGGVTIVSQQTGVGGQQGNYTVTASAANVTVAEPMGFFGWKQQVLVGNSLSSQLVDIGLAAGFALFVGSAAMRSTAAPGAEYQFGTHAQQMYDSQNRSQIFSPVAKAPAVPTGTWIGTTPQYVESQQPQLVQAQPSTAEDQYSKTVFRTIIAPPQQIDFTLQAWFPHVFIPQGSSAPGAEYQFGTHQKALYDSQNSTAIWHASIKPPVAGGQVPLRSFHIQPQLFDYTLQASLTQPIVETGWLISMITAGPQLADLTQNAVITGLQLIAPKQSPVGFFAAPQADPTQPQPSISQTKLSATQQPNRTVGAFIFSQPVPWDYTVNQGSIFPINRQSGAQQQPAVIQVYEQQYDKTIFPQLVVAPIIYNPPIFVPVPPPQAPPPEISEWTTDATQVTADSINYTADGSNLIAGGGLPTEPTPPESSGSGNPGPVRNVSQNLRF